jgi:hypothetical protein
MSDPTPPSQCRGRPLPPAPVEVNPPSVYRQDRTPPPPHARPASGRKPLFRS